jgi:hypothetical protein
VAFFYFDPPILIERSGPLDPLTTVWGSLDPSVESTVAAGPKVFPIASGKARDREGEKKENTAFEGDCAAPLPPSSR